MFARNRLAARFVLLAFCCGGFVVLWTWVDGWYASQFQAGAMNLCRLVGGNHWAVVLKPLDNPTDILDTELFLLNRETKAMGRQPISSRYLGYAPTTLLLALIAASPVSWGRRVWAMFWGLALVHAWIAMSLLLLVIHGYSRGSELALWNFGPAVAKCLAYLVEVVAIATVTKYAVPAVIWVLVTFRRGDWERVMRA